MATSTRNLSMGLIAALLLHWLILAQKLVFDEHHLQKDKLIAVTLLQEEVKRPKKVREEPPQKSEEKIVEPNSVLPKTDAIITATKPDVEAEPGIVIQTSSHSTLFKSWLKSETESFVNQNPDSVSDFDQTFSPQLQYESPEELSPDNPKSTLRGYGVFAVEKDGRKTCVAENVNLLDISGRSNFVAKDCTPKKKFDLKLNQPNNGWSNR